MIGILIVSHGAFGDALLHCAGHVLGQRPQQARPLGVTIHDDPDAVLTQARELVKSLDDGSGVLVFTDMLGATPSNIATRLIVPGKVEGVAGVNLPMLIRALTYREEPLAEVVRKATSGGRDGVTPLVPQS